MVSVVGDVVVVSVTVTVVGGSVIVTVFVTGAEAARVSVLVTVVVTAGRRTVDPFPVPLGRVRRMRGPAGWVRACRI